MSKTVRSTIVSLLFATAAGGLLLASLRFPLWQMRMTSPQYQDQETLRVNVYAGAMHGDLNEIHVLNKYIGVTAPTDLPQFRWMPPALIAGAALGVLLALLPLGARRGSQALVAMAVAVAVLGAAALAQFQMYRIGHERNPRAALRGVKDFTPPILGTVKIENFTVSAWPGVGSWLIAGAIVLYICGAVGRPKGWIGGRWHEHAPAKHRNEHVISA